MDVRPPSRTLPRRPRVIAKILFAALPLSVFIVPITFQSGASAGETPDPTTDVSVSMTDNPDPVAPSGLVTFTIPVTNEGSTTYAQGVQATFTTDFSDGGIVAVRLDAGEGDSCTSEGEFFVSCNLGSIAEQDNSEEPSTETIEVDVIAPSGPGEGGEIVALADFSFFSSAEVTSANEGADDGLNNSEIEETTVSEGGGDSDSGTIPPGGSLSTVSGTTGNPVSPADPFALTLKNSSTTTLDASIAEEPCDGSQSGDPLCSQPRLGGVLGNFQFEPATATFVGGAAPNPGPVVTVGRLFYDRTLKNQANGVRIFYQKTETSPVIRLPRCDPMTTECFRVRNLASGDQIIRVAFGSDPRVTRG